MGALRQRIFDFLTLFTSAGTLLCCALPAGLVMLGAGGVMASLVSTVPGIVVVSYYKKELFLISGLMLSLGGYLQYRARGLPCPLDVQAAKTCMRTRRWSLGTYLFSLALYSVGLFFAYIAPRLI
jgi:hypothetical protein